MRGIGPLLPARFHQPFRGQAFQERVQRHRLQPRVRDPRPELRQDRVVETGIIQGQAEQVLQVQPRPDRLGGHPAGHVLDPLQRRDQGQHRRGQPRTAPDPESRRDHRVRLRPRRRLHRHDTPILRPGRGDNNSRSRIMATITHPSENPTRRAANKPPGSGLVGRAADPADGRVVQLRITGDGRAMLAGRRAVRAERVAGLLDRISPGEREALAAALPAMDALVNAERGEAERVQAEQAGAPAPAAATGVILAAAAGARTRSALTIARRDHGEPPRADPRTGSPASAAPRSGPPPAPEADPRPVRPRSRLAARRSAGWPAPPRA
jgi:hypothetical protein